MLVVGLVAALVLRQTVLSDDDDASDDETVETSSGESFDLAPSDVIMEPANHIGLDSFSVEPLAQEVPPEYTAPDGAEPGAESTPTTIASNGAVIINATPAPAQGVVGRRRVCTAARATTPNATRWRWCSS